MTDVDDPSRALQPGSVLFGKYRVERVLWIGLAVVLEQVPLEPLERYGDEKAGRHDPIRVDVVAAQRKTAACNVADG